MVITVNGTERRLQRGSSVADLLRELGLAGGAVAVERNQRLVGPKDHVATRLEDGDALQVVTLVGGASGP
ncbi:MAG: sulfur carrier protein ThiS [Planctomycetes bacterium]|nr:sulfur carrier protein ThiS [Planctomycetota bacterium]